LSFVCLFVLSAFRAQNCFYHICNLYRNLIDYFAVVDESSDNAARACPKFVVGSKGEQQSLTNAMTHIVVD